MTGYLKLYWCLCSESADHDSWIPDQCQGHFLTLAATVRNEEPGPMAARHECAERLCSGGYGLSPKHHYLEESA